MTMLISVVITTYNRLDALEAETAAAESEMKTKIASLTSQVMALSEEQVNLGLTKTVLEQGNAELNDQILAEKKVSKKYYVYR